MSKYFSATLLVALFCFCGDKVAAQPAPSLRAEQTYQITGCKDSCGKSIGVTLNVNAEPTAKARGKQPAQRLEQELAERRSWIRSATVYDGTREVPSQLDDLDGDGIFDWLSFDVELDASGKKTIKVVYSAAEASRDRYSPQTAAILSLRNNGKVEAVTEASSTVDNMYNKVVPHGPAFESELIAYRVYFDKRQTIDVYGKCNRGLELGKTGWYPSAQQLASGAGDDVLMVFSSVSVGTLRGWDPVKKCAVDIDPVGRRTMRIVASGPVCAIVEVKVDEWQYQGQTIDLSSLYVMRAGRRDVQVTHRFTGDAAGLTFCTGVMKMANRTTRIEPSKGGRISLAGVWGEDYPLPDTVKFGKQAVGLAIAIPNRYVVSQEEDKASYLYTVTPKENQITYTFTAAAAKETFGYKNADEFFGYMRDWGVEMSCDVESRRISK